MNWAKTGEIGPFCLPSSCLELALYILKINFLKLYFYFLNNKYMNSVC